MEIRPEVQRGAALLDDVDPTWWTRLDPANLHMETCFECVVGQLYPQGMRMPEVWAISEFDAEYGFDLTYTDMQLLGGKAHPDSPRWIHLRDEWIAAAKLRANT